MSISSREGTTRAQVSPQPIVDISAQGGGECRSCGRPLTDVFVDLGMSPPCDYVPHERLESPEVFYRLRVWICAGCLLVQLPPHVPAEEILAGAEHWVVEVTLE